MKWLMALGLILTVGSVSAGMMMSKGNRVMSVEDTIIEVSGVIVAPPPCQINKDKSTDVDFGDVVIQGIDGKRYTRDVPVSIDCSPTFTGELAFKINGASSPFDESALETSNSDLAIQLTLNGSALKLNEWQGISWRMPLEIKAVPIKNPKKSPTAGPFTVTATMLIAVQ